MIGGVPFARVALVLAAVVVCAWFVVGIRQARDTTRASAIINANGSIPAARAALASSELKAAGWLNPDREVDILRGQLASYRGDVAGAVSILGQVTRDEPMNLQAWAALAAAALNDNRYRPVFLTAIRTVARLHPGVK